MKILSRFEGSQIPSVAGFIIMINYIYNQLSGVSLEGPVDTPVQFIRCSSKQRSLYLNY